MADDRLKESGPPIYVKLSTGLDFSSSPGVDTSGERKRRVFDGSRIDFAAPGDRNLVRGTVLVDQEGQRRIGHIPVLSGKAGSPSQPILIGKRDFRSDHPRPERPDRPAPRHDLIDARQDQRIIEFDEPACLNCATVSANAHS